MSGGGMGMGGSYGGGQLGGGYGGGQLGGGYGGGQMGNQYGGRDSLGGGYGGEQYGSRSFGGYGGESRSYGGSSMDRQSHRGKGPKNFQRSDERVREIICEALSDDDQIDANEIEVEVKSGEVVLRGTVDDRRTKRLAEDLAERVSGCDVQNQLRVGSTSGNKWQVSSRGNQTQGKEVVTTESDKKHRA
jgi:osmotically-inducible protein OsmY